MSVLSGSTCILYSEISDVCLIFKGEIKTGLELIQRPGRNSWWTAEF